MSAIFGASCAQTSIEILYASSWLLYCLLLVVDYLIWCTGVIQLLLLIRHLYLIGESHKEIGLCLLNLDYLLYTQ